MVFMPHWPIPHKITPIRHDLSAMLALMEQLGHPHLRLPPVLHVAGTNGKGSTIAFLRSIFEAAGHKVHTYTSPHLLEFNERIVLAGEKIFDNHLFELCERVRLAAESLSVISPLSPTFFESTTAAAFLAFSETPADILLLETGLGGRLDATNIIPNPILTILTPISYDHMVQLGPTLPIIAGEKAGIIKPHVPCIISAQVTEVMDVFLDRCESVGTEAIAYGYDFSVEKIQDSIRIESIYGTREYALPCLPGDHQILNSATTVVACNMLKQFDIQHRHISQGLQNAIWPGRLQKIIYNKREIWLDGAHNTGGAQVLALWIRENLPKPISLVLGMTKNRDAAAFAMFFKNIVDEIYCVKVMSEPSSYSAESLAQLIDPSSIPTHICGSIEEAITMCPDGEIVVTGSLFLVADSLKISGLSV